ncbi:hypothetical protein [Sporosarcina trichiuri]|uniref:hypothetical protein n=1 Tax=Sporosarcina trichiuri TaxID=3056445 RepID=UPI0025B5D653|nr:hypothetical protein [Sporosarcina sp. 0.2-SM1T-5]WJY27303.1 hypothetical protein QWT68_14875 [Sporosarcina sp. 0.2-SM1T-5]
METFQWIALVLIWVVPALLSYQSYRRLQKEEHEELKQEIGSPLIFFTYIPFVIGVLLFLSGSEAVTGLKAVQDAGMANAFFGWIVLWIGNVVTKAESAARSLSMIAVGTLVLIAYVHFL